MTIEDDYPSLNNAYELVPQSYDYTERRLQSVEAWMQNLQAFAVTITLGAIVIATGINEDISLTSWWLLGVAIAFGLSYVIAFVARHYLSLVYLDPGRLLENGWLEKQEASFKRDLIEAAGADFKHNVSMISRKAVAAQAMALLLLIETALLLAWIWTER